jgi:RNA-binding protein YlmH
MTDDSHPINPFTSAKRVPIVLVSYRVDDVMDALPKLSKQQAEALLAKHGMVIAHTMLVAAEAVVCKLADGGDDDQ